MDPDIQDASIRSIDQNTQYLACHPFTYVQKDWIVVSIQKIGHNGTYSVLHAVVKVTIKHIKSLGDLDYKTYVPGSPVPVCGKCFGVKKENGSKQMSRLITSGCSYAYGTGLLTVIIGCLTSYII